MIARFMLSRRRRFSSTGGWEYIVNGKYGLLNPIDFVARSIEILHINSGLGWTGSIILSSIFIRTLLVPFGIGQIKSMYATANIKPLMDKHRETILALRKDKKHEEILKESKLMNKINSDNGINIASSLFSVLFSGFVHGTMFFGVRSMILQPVSSFSSEGWLWFTNLLEPDTSFILPFISSITMYLQFKATPNINPPNDQTRMMKRLAVIFSLGSPIITSHFSSGILVYMVCSNLYNLLFKVCMLSSKVRIFFRIQDLKYPPPPEPSTIDNIIQIKDNVMRNLRSRSAPPIPKNCKTVEKSGKVLHFR